MNSEEIVEALNFAKSNNLQTYVLSGGSNIVFSDFGFDGLIIYLTGGKIDIIFENEDYADIEVDAGVEWDKLVEWSVNKGFSGIECLSGIPGSTGATPIQNVGAYGQEVSESILKLTLLDKVTFDKLEISNEFCEFSYRNSIFKNKYKGKYIITKVLFRLSKKTIPQIKYPDLINKLGNSQEYINLEDRTQKLLFIRDTVIEIRKIKSMVYNKNDSDSISCGSFFTNPVLTQQEYDENPLLVNIPAYNTGKGIKLSAARIIEDSGFSKGYLYKGIGISSKHSLALINKEGTAKGLKELAEIIKSKVFEKFRINLEAEPNIL